MSVVVFILTSQIFHNFYGLSSFSLEASSNRCPEQQNFCAYFGKFVFLRTYFARTASGGLGRSVSLGGRGDKYLHVVFPVSSIWRSRLYAK